MARAVGADGDVGGGMAHADGRLWVVTPTGVFKSEDQGGQWMAAGLDGLDVRCIAVLDGVVHVGTQGDGLYRSADEGVTWEPTGEGLASTNFRAIEAHNGMLFAGGQIGTGVYRSIDGGDSWVLLGNGIPVGSYRGFASNGEWLAAGSFGGGVFVSPDDGDSWTAVNEGLGDLTLFDLDFSDTHLHAATNEAGAWRIPLSQLGASNIAGSAAGLPPLWVWPNPCRDRLHVEGWSGAAFEALDAAGRIVASGQIGDSGLDVSGWPGGIVILRVEGMEGRRAILVDHR